MAIFAVTGLPSTGSRASILRLWVGVDGQLRFVLSPSFAPCEGRQGASPLPGVSVQRCPVRRTEAAGRAPRWGLRARKWGRDSERAVQHAKTPRDEMMSSRKGECRC